MSRLLFLQASPRKERSRSAAVARAFVDACAASRPGLDVVEKNLFDAELPPFDGHALQVKYNILHSRSHTPRELRAWRAVENLIDEFAGFDLYVFAVPMWNFSIPYRLKHYIDLICQPGYAFEVQPDGAYQGLFQGKAAAIYSRGGAYPATDPLGEMNHQSPYLDFILQFMGLSVEAKLEVELTLAEQTVRNEKLEQATNLAAELGAAF
jgi:FMN-dependent NADH-azoreductase